MKKLLRMARSTDGLAHIPPPQGIQISPYCSSLHHARVRMIYAESFGEEPWPEDWDTFNEFDSRGMFLAIDATCDETIGFVISFKRKDYGYISVVAVIPSYRRKGIASSLISCAVQYLWTLGLDTVKIDVYATNVPAFHLYTKLGFQIIETFYES